MEQSQVISQTIRSSEGERRVYFIAFLAALSISLAIVEHMVPRPLPWMRFGLANAITLYAFGVLRPKEVFLLVIARVVASSLLIGSFLSVTFLLSLSGALSSFFVMLSLFLLFRRFFSLIGISVAGALTSNAVQLLVVNTLFINSRISYYLLPLILLFALGGGILSGLFGRFLTEHI
jgi:heptaprenyl diphosphate synthase